MQKLEEFKKKRTNKKIVIVVGIFIVIISLLIKKTYAIYQKETSYWISSRYFNYNNGNYSFNGRIIDIDGNLKESELITFNSLVGLNNQLSGFSIRPVLTLKKDINITSGDGKSVNTAYQLN